ncbi:aldo-keto reductase [Bombardia bombarda]|uniref:Aldo-keto reductase n=1 Tax=Bombardia bombarda TaxID=252184 RepID=A0AA40BVX6_9PEZI|nr:aldo-keto reductase [Bombardia bombarda]
MAHVDRKALGLSLAPSAQKSIEATKVDYVHLGSSGLRVSWPILGAMTLGAPKAASFVLDEDTSLDVLKAAYDMGINTWDTANSYSNGLSEQVIGKALNKFNIPRQKVVIMTKICFHVGEEPDVIGVVWADELNQSKDYVNQGGLSRTAILSAVDASLARLNTTYIDVLQIHRPDPHTPPEETMRTLHELVQSGKVRYLGASSMWATQFASLQFLAERNGWTKFVSMQNYYNLCYREEEREMLRFCRETGVGVVPWSPLFGGRLARPVGYDKSARSKMRNAHHPTLTDVDEEIIGRVEQLAKEKGWSMSCVALAWHKSKGTVPIVGLNSVERVREMGELKGKVLSGEELRFLEELYVAREVAGHV